MRCAISPKKRRADDGGEQPEAPGADEDPAEIEQRSQNPFDKGKPGRQTAHKLVRQSGCPTENQPQPEADDDKT